MEMRSYVIISCILFALFMHVQCCDEGNCLATTGTVCNNQGTCECGVCKCNSSYTGPTCEECPTCPSPCEIYQDCVSCKLFGTGPLGTVECMDKCDKILTLLPVYETEEFESPSDGKIVCKNVVKLRKDKYCMELFMVGNMEDGFRNIYCYPEQDCSEKYSPTNPPVLEVTLSKEDENNGPEVSSGNKAPEEAGAASGTKQGQSGDDNGTAANTISVSLTFIMAVLSLYL